MYDFLHFTSRICRFNFNFIFQPCIWQFVFYPFQYFFLLLLVCHFFTHEVNYTQAYISTYVRTLFVNVFRNCSNSLRREGVRVHILVFRTVFCFYSSLIFVYTFVFVPFFSTCVCLFCTTVCAVFVFISLDSFTT